MFIGITKDAKRTTRFLQALVTAGIFLSGNAKAQEIGFADDFSVDSTLFHAGSFSSAIGESTITPTADGALLYISAEDSNVAGSLFIEPNSDADKFGIEITHLDDGTVDPTDYVNVFLEAYLYSETSPETQGYENGLGTVEAEITYGYNSSGELGFNYCLLRDTGNGDQERVNNICSSFPGIVPVFGQKYALSVELDRAASEVVFNIDDQSLAFEIPATIYPPSQNFRRIQLYVSNDDDQTRDITSTASAILHTVTLGDRVVNVASNPPLMDRYRYCCDDRIGSAYAVVDGQLRMTTESSTEDRYNGISLQIQKPTDYIEATVTLSSESDLGERGEIQGRLEASLYNENTDFGNDGYTGDVFVELRARVGANGRSEVQACLRRQLTADRSESENLLDNGNHCTNLSLRAEFDQPIRMAIALDKNAGTITFRANDKQFVWQVDGPMYQPHDAYSNINVSGWKGGTPVVYFDNLRTAESAQTTSEATAGTGIEPFPAVTEPEIANSTLLNPLPIEPVKLDFVDDFSTSTNDFTFNPDQNRGTYGMAISDGAVQLEATQTDPEDCCASATIHLSKPSDFISAKVSLSSESSLPINHDAEAKVRIEGIFYNDTANGGFDGRTGDVYIQNRIRINGDGRREASVCLDRQVENGDDERVQIFDGDNCVTFDTIPQLDTVYELSIRLNRDEGTVSVAIDDEIITAPLMTPTYTASNAYNNVQLQHQVSGRAVGKIHSISTDNFSQNFANDPPIFAPYHGLRDNGNPGVNAVIEDGQLKITLDGTMHDGDRTRFSYVSRSPTDFIGATIRISSESVPGSGNFNMGVGGHLYNDIQDGGLGLLENGNNNDEGAVYPILRAVFNRNGSNFFEYCAWRSNTENFSSSIELVTGVVDPEFGDCQQVDGLVPQQDTDYKLSINLNRENSTIEYSIDDNVYEYQITTAIYKPGNFWQGIRTDAFDNAKLVGYADDLAYSANPVPLAQSKTLLGNAEPTSDGSTSSSGGGGCSISSNSGLQAPLALLALMLFMRVVRRRS